MTDRRCAGLLLVLGLSLVCFTAGKADIGIEESFCFFTWCIWTEMLKIPPSVMRKNEVCHCAP